MIPGDLSQVSMLDLFRMEAETQGQVMTAGLLALERDCTAAEQLELCMRAAHSLKGAARIVGLTVGVTVAHAMEDCFVAAQQGRIRLGRTHIDQLLAGMDLLARIASTPEGDLDDWTGQKESEVETCLSALARVLAGHDGGEPSAVAERQPTPSAAPQPESGSWAGRDNSDRVLRVTAESLNQLLGLAGESLVESRWVKPFAQSLLRLKRMHHDACNALDSLREALSDEPLDEHAQAALAQAQRRALDCQQFLSRRLVELEVFDGRALNLAHRLYDEALACRMRPFGDGVQGFPRMVRDLASSLGKQVKLELVGEATRVDRDILVKLDAPLGHLLRNAVDHGIEPLEERLAAGKAAEGTIRLEARHCAGALQIIVSDDGRGVDLAGTRDLIVKRKLIDREAAGTLSEAELADVGGEPYAFPLASIVRTLQLSKDRIELLEGRQHFDCDGRRIGLVTAHQVLGTAEPALTGDELPVIVLGDPGQAYGLVVDRFLGERELVVQPLDPQLGKIKDIAAGALMDDGSPVLIVDPEDLIRSMDKLVAAGHLSSVSPKAACGPVTTRKRVLVVDDSLTVRELERKLLDGHGYDVEVAVDGMDGWNAVRTGRFDLVITDIDMPRMDGIELVSLIHENPNLSSLPVMVVSYKDRDEDRQRGLDAGAAYYLTKGSFHDETLLQAVVDLIGDAGV